METTWLLFSIVSIPLVILITKGFGVGPFLCSVSIMSILTVATVYLTHSSSILERLRFGPRTELIIVFLLPLILLLALTFLSRSIPRLDWFGFAILGAIFVFILLDTSNPFFGLLVSFFWLLGPVLAKIVPHKSS
jgi:hypothetical protein